ncbi:hypothetical protein PsorP6_017376 [Peronosclerospora sorghi]|uniref:Uncharacterized protein n=1 Tax=Peronosclerospora sorghi TaxID=230839 RepID=A0ACC0WKZ5_9STRA|nr:hypothetical protein PsorP6_017376 [Peronosclerospora sorghi]
MGQQYLGPALLHALEGLTHVSLDYPSLLADAHAYGPEEALIRRLREAQTCLPSVVYLPQIDLWWKNTSDAMHVTLKMMLTSLQAQRNLPILFLACTSSTSGDHERVPADLRALFEDDPSVARSSLVLKLPAPCANARQAHFEEVFASIATPPVVQKTKRRKREQLEVLSVAPLAPRDAKGTICLPSRDVPKRLRAYPTMYGDYGQRFLKRTSKTHVRPNELSSGVRASARLRGLKAPGIDGKNASESVSTAKSSRHGDGVKSGTRELKHSNGVLQVEQWFNDEEKDEEETGKTTVAGDQVESRENCGDDEWMIKPEEDPEQIVFYEGDQIFVSSRSFRGMNREGGAGSSKVAIKMGRTMSNTFLVAVKKRQGRVH